MKKISKLLFIDRDSPSVNNYTYKIIGDTKQLFYYECKTYEDDREGEPQTVITCGKIQQLTLMLQYLSSWKCILIFVTCI